ncbi:MAG: EAL domain-containing protein [Desulfobacterales bacterium]|nr:EAL domain-containing protein [Desulfobacterales bacterium]
MSLLKQIQILVTLLLLITLIIVLRINFNTAREFTANQSYLNAKNLANVLALSLSSRPSDDIFMRTSINAMFDGGYYESITFLHPDGNVIYKKSEKLAVYGVPAFFSDYIDLVIPVAEARVMEGWSIFGTLQIKGHPGQSYKKLWEILKQLCLQFALLGSIVILINYIGLRHLLRALEKIKHQAQEISNNEFIINPDIPKTPELKKVVLAMNVMVQKVETIFDRHLENLASYQELRYKDRITGLHNRSFFVKQLAQFIKNRGEKARGQVILLGLTGMEGIELSGNRSLTHKIFKHLAQTLKKETESIGDALVARLPRREFAAILPGSSSEKGLEVAKAAISNFLPGLSHEKALPDSIAVYGGLVSYNHEDDLSTVLSKADYALSKARTGLHGTVRIFKEEQSQAVIGKSAWKTLIEDTFFENRFFLTVQSVMSGAKEFHREVFVNMVDRKGVQHQAGLFMPMVLTLGLASRLDRYILEQSARYLSDNPEHAMTVNITTEFCRDRLAGPWLRKFLMEHKSLQDLLIFEIHETTLIQHPEICIDFVGLITGMGFKFGLDQYTMHDASLSLLKKIKPYYIKIERDYLEVFDDPEKVDMVLNALFTISDSLGIKLIATKIENKAQQQVLADRNINYFQGHGIAGIVPLRDKNE